MIVQNSRWFLIDVRVKSGKSTVSWKIPKRIPIIGRTQKDRR